MDLELGVIDISISRFSRSPGGFGRASDVIDDVKIWGGFFLNYKIELIAYKLILNCIILNNAN